MQQIERKETQYPLQFIHIMNIWGVSKQLELSGVAQRVSQLLLSSSQ